MAYSVKRTTTTRKSASGRVTRTTTTTRKYGNRTTKTVRTRVIRK